MTEEKFKMLFSDKVAILKAIIRKEGITRPEDLEYSEAQGLVLSMCSPEFEPFVPEGRLSEWNEYYGKLANNGEYKSLFEAARCAMNEALSDWLIDEAFDDLEGES